MADNAETNLSQFKAGIIDNNPVMVQLLGMCPTLAITNSVENALVMGAAATFVVVMSNLITSLDKVHRSFVPDELSEDFARYVRSTLGPALDRFGLERQDGKG